MESDVRPTKKCLIEDEFENYDVFISHRGPDTKTGFVGFLYDYLKEAGLLPFLDCKVIDKGQDAWTCIEHAIKTSSIGLVIFSENFAQSKWCLDELHVMLKTLDMKVVPIFYKVQPCDVKYPEKGPFAAAFDKLKERHEETQLKEWKEDLVEVSKLVGWEHKATVNRSLDIDLVKDIVKKVFEMANKALPLDVGEHVFGVKEVAIEIIQKLDENKKVALLGLWGMGGIGKSTLAKELYNHLRKRFAAVCYVEDVADKMVQSNGIVEVQNNMLNDLGPKDVKRITNKSMGKATLEEVLCKKRVLLVLDDISDNNDISLLISRKMLGEGSLCIITSRNKRVLNAFKADEVHIHDVQGLSKGHSIQVLAFYAFGGLQEMKLGFEDLVESTSQACGGIPLVLKVCGALLRNEEEVDVWRDVLKKLNNGIVMNEVEIFKCLRISFDALQGEHQEMFLDITCALLGKPRDLAMRTWKSHGWHVALGMRTLVERALVIVDKNGCFCMHDHLRDMGREIVRKKRESDGVVRRLWMPEAATFLEGDVGSLESLETLIVFQRSSSLDISHMKKLRILMCDDSTNLVMSSIPKGLCWWDWYGPWFRAPKLKRIYPTILANNKLVILKIFQRSIFTMLPEAFQELKNLEVLNLKGCENLSMLPESFGGLNKLQDLNLELSGIKNLPKTFGRLINLEVLNLSKCSNLCLLPESMGDLTMLRELKLEGSQITKFPDSFGGLSNLEILNMPSCKGLHWLPEWFGCLKKLRDLNLESSRITSLPKSFRGLINLEVLNLAWCKNLKFLPESFGGLKKLQDLSLNHSALSCLPNSIGDLINMEVLSLAQCRYLMLLPKSFGNLKRLQDLNLESSGISCLPESFGELSNLKVLDLTACEQLLLLPQSIRSLQNITNFWYSRSAFEGLLEVVDDLELFETLTIPSKLIKLSCLMEILNTQKQLQLVGFAIEALPESFGELNTLEVLRVVNCESLKLLPESIGCLKMLQDLSLNLSTLRCLPNSFGDLNNLEVLDLSRCRSLELLPYSFGLLGKLRNLKLNDSKVKSLPESFGDLNNLEVLDLSRCRSLELLPYSFGLLGKLWNLELNKSMVKSLPDSFGDLNNLEVLDPSWCGSLELLPYSFGRLGKLQNLNLYGSMVKSLPESFGDLNNLEVLDLSWCESLELLPYSFGRLGKLQNLNLYGSIVKSLPESFGDLNNLEVLDLSQCRSLELLPYSFGRLGKLRNLELYRSMVKSLPESFGDLNNLEVLDLSWCESLELLPYSFGRLGKLQNLKLNGSMVKSLPESFGDLNNLEVLDLSWCESLELLPYSFGRLGKLQNLNLYGSRVKSLPESFGDLNNLEVLDLSRCRSLELLPYSFGRLGKLQNLKLNGSMVKSLPV